MPSQNKKKDEELREGRGIRVSGSWSEGRDKGIMILKYHNLKSNNIAIGKFTCVW